MIATRRRGDVTTGPTISCRVDHAVCVTLKNIVQISNYTQERTRHLDELSGVFLDTKWKRPTTVLLINTAKKSEFHLDVLLYSSPKDTCGLFYAVTFKNTSLWESVNKTGIWPPGLTEEEVFQNLRENDTIIQCHIRLNGTDTHPTRTKDCNDQWYLKCPNTVPWVVYRDSCPYIEI